MCGCKIGQVPRKSNAKSVSATIDPDQQEELEETTLLNQELQAMVRIAGTILRYTDMEDILAAIARELSAVVRFDRSSVAFLSPDEQSLLVQQLSNEEDKSGGRGETRRIPVDENTAIGWVALNKKPILRRDIANDDRFLEAVEEECLQSEVVVPLVARGTLIGTLNVGCRSRNALTQKDLDVLVDCGNIACGAIEHALLLSEAEDIGELYKTFQRNASDIIILIDKDTGKLIETNRKCSEILGYTDAELTAKSYFDLFPREEQLQARRDFINVLSQKSKSFVDRRLISRDGRIIVVDISANLITIKTDTFIQVLFHDISQRKMLEQQIVLQNKNLQDANKKLREVDRMKTEFLNNISHELRTPLSIIIAYSESLRDPRLTTDEQTCFLDIIAKNGGDLLQLIDDLLDLSRLEISGAMLNITLSHIHDVIRSLWEQAQKHAAEKSIEMRFQPGEDIPVIYIDNRRILQVLWCLVQNAIKFTDSGGSVEVRTKREGDRVRVQVEDTGVGIPPDEIKSIFDSFRQLDGSSTRVSGGLGIGLAMAKHIVELHDGRIWAESEEGKGSIFNFVLPVDTEVTFLADTDADLGTLTQGKEQ